MPKGIGFRTPGELTVKSLVQVEIRCREHEREEPTCPACRFLRSAERNLVYLRSRRDSLFRQICARLAANELIIIDLR